MNATATSTRVDLSAVRSLATATEAVASVYLNLRPAEYTTDTVEDLGLRWRRLAAQLSAQGADRATVDAIGRRLADQPVAPARSALFASRGSLLFHQDLPGPDGADRARFGAPADVVPLLAFLEQPAYVLAVTDRTGADLTQVPRGAVVGSTTTVVGPDDEIERNAPGGWAQARYQRRAEDSWQHNAGAVAAGVTRALQEVRAPLLLVAGDVRAIQLLRDQLPAGVRDAVSVRQLPGGRRPDRYGTVRDTATADALAGYVTTRTEALLDRFDAERHQGGRAVEGVAATLAALARRRVDTLIVVDDPDDERVAWFGPDTLCAPAPRDPGRTTPGEAVGRLVDVAVRAAVLADADVRVVPLGQARAPAERIGALCRFVET